MTPACVWNSIQPGLLSQEEGDITWLIPLAVDVVVEQYLASVQVSRPLSSSPEETQGACWEKIQNT